MATSVSGVGGSLSPSGGGSGGGGATGGGYWALIGGGGGGPYDYCPCYPRKPPPPRLLSRHP